MRLPPRRKPKWSPQLKLKSAIVGAGLSQREVAAMAYDSGKKDLNEQRLSQIVRGEGKRPTATEKQTLAKLLKKSVKALFLDDDDKPRPGRAQETEVSA